MAEPRGHRPDIGNMHPEPVALLCQADRDGIIKVLCPFTVDRDRRQVFQVFSPEAPWSEAAPPVRSFASSPAAFGNAPGD